MDGNTCSNELFEGRIVIVDKKKAKIVKELGESIIVIFQNAGQYQGPSQTVSKSSAKSLHLKKQAKNIK